MKKFAKELAWKVPITVAWFQCTPWFNNVSLGFWERTVICGLFVLSLDLIRFGLKQ